uniref:(northern house mosquito) hypothetical protein n=1 Tax=Culex pipiens TaxID=7175 RepID=A0A8D8CYS1_CULPI
MVRIAGESSLEEEFISRAPLSMLVKSCLFRRVINAIKVMRMMQAIRTPSPTAARVISGWDSPSIETIGTSFSFTSFALKVPPSFSIALLIGSSLPLLFLPGLISED